MQLVRIFFLRRNFFVGSDNSNNKDMRGSRVATNLCKVGINYLFLI